MPNDFDAFLAQVLQDEDDWRREQTVENAIPLPALPTIYLRHGEVYKVTPPNHDSWKDVRFIVSDGQVYDLEKVEDIERIPLPYSSSGDTADPHALIVILREKASLYYDQVKKLCAACLWKSTRFMLTNLSS